LKKVYYSFILFVVMLHSQPLRAQLCDPSTPVINVNLSGNPMGIWISPPVTRDGLCCNASSPDVCVEFVITLDPAAIGITFNIASGAIPPGALYYLVNCGPPVEVGQPICLNGAGPHHLTFCKPGNNQNTYSITSFANPVIIANVSNNISPQCSAILTAQVANVETLTWTSVPYNGIYNSFLSCTTNCDTVTITPAGNFPAYIDYLVCGTGIGNCSNPATVCDTVRVYLYNDVAVSVSPSNITLCNGITTTTITASVTGGSGAYQYLWTNGQTTASISAGAGTYNVTVTDTATCVPVSGSATINVLPPIVANAGPDVTVCANLPAVNLNGSLQTATAAIWNGGTGTYNPNNATLNANYTPSASEIANGFAELILETTANQGCPPGYDTIHITIVQPPTPSINGSLVACANSSTSYSVAILPGCSYSWNVTGGTINGSSTSNSITVNWSSAGSGTVSVTITNSSGCTATDSKTISLVILPNPVVTGSELCMSVYFRFIFCQLLTRQLLCMVCHEWSYYRQRQQLFHPG
jgi:large repetitive protein